MAETISSQAHKRIAVVTGANKGIGFEICKQLLNNGVRVILTARDEGRGNGAVERLRASGVPDVVFHQLDVSEPTSIASLANFIKTQFGRLDILVNNAAIGGVAVDYEVLASLGDEAKQVGLAGLASIAKAMREPYEETEACLKINYYGTKEVTETLIPLLQLSTSPRIVNVSSFYGKLQYLGNEELKQELVDDGLREERIDEMLTSFLNDFKEGKVGSNGWPSFPSAYKLSKIAINAYTRILARKFPTLCINSVHPGFAKTDINLNTGNMSAAECAKGPVMLALLPESSSPSGLFFNQMAVTAF